MVAQNAMRIDSCYRANRFCAPTLAPWRLSIVFFSLLCSLWLTPVTGGRRGEKPRITKPPVSVATVAGQSTLFVCSVDGNPAPKVQWKVSGVAVSESHFGQTLKAPRGSVFRVPNVIPAYNGAQITCSATNALGRAEASANLVVYADESLSPEGFPKFLNEFSVIVAKKNGAVELECRTSGDPPPAIGWYRNSIPVDATGVHGRFTQLDNGNLRITELVEDDEGKYECMATNDKGSRLSAGDDLLVRENVETSLQLIAPSTRRFRPHLTNVPPARQIVPPGGRLSLTCTAVGAPLPTVNWYRGSRRLHHEHLEGEAPGTARILLLDLSESVNVSCVAESAMGRVYHEVQVVVKNLPHPPGKPHLIDVGSTYAHIAFEASPDSSSTAGTPPVTSSYLLFWMPTSHFDNRSLELMPAHLPGSAGQTGFEQSNRPDSIQPAYSLIPADVKNMTRSADGSRLTMATDTGRSRVTQAIVTSMTQLKPSVNYTVWARAVGLDHDASGPGPVATFCTQEIAPSSPPRNVHAQAISNAAVTVYWDPPLEANGKIRAYRVYYTNRPQQELPFWDTNIVDLDSAANPLPRQPGTSVESSHAGRLAILSHLTANATYFVRVSAVNAKGEGPPSDVAVVIVRPGLLSKPRNFTARTKSSHEVHLSWSPPEDMEQPTTRSLRQYRLEYGPAPATSGTTGLAGQDQWPAGPLVDARNELIEASKTSLLVTGLRPDTQYVFSLAALSTAGPGVNAMARARTKKYVPAEPRNLSVEVISSTELSVRWQPPVLGPRFIDQGEVSKSPRIAYYDLAWRPATSTGGWLTPEASEAPWTSNTVVGNLDRDSHGFSRRLVPAHTDPDDSSSYVVKLTGLQPATFYVVQIRAVASSGMGDRSLSNPVKTWDPPPPAPSNLQLFNQILPPSGPRMPPQALIKVSWERPSEWDTSTGTQHQPAQIEYRVRWRLVLSNPTTSREGVARRMREASLPDRWLFWSELEEEDSPKEIIPEQYLGGEINTTERSWNPPPTLFFLGMMYEFRVAVINAIQAGQEAIRLINLEGSAPTGSPIDLKTTTQHDTALLLSWSPPEWTHRHGPFTAYEVRCEALNPVGNSLRQVNLTLENSHINWPESGRLGLPQSLIAWPRGQVNLMRSPEFGPDLLSRDIECRVRGHTKYGTGPWSLGLELYAKHQAAVPPPPKHIHALLFPNGELSVNWAMPAKLVQTLLSPLDDAVESSLPGIVYRRFAVYWSPAGARNWTRQLTNGPVTEFTVVVPTQGHHESTLEVRVSSIGSGGHEGTWSDPVHARSVSSGGVGVPVHNLTCLSVYSNQLPGWTLRLRWTNPPWLLTNADRLQHFRVNYTWSPGSMGSREMSVASPGSSVPSTFEHWLQAMRPDTVYTVSVRPVIWFDDSQAAGDGDLFHYGLQTHVRCSVPKTKPSVHVEPPWLINRGGDLKSKPSILTVGCAARNATQYPATFELLARRLDDALADLMVLARWSSSHLDEVDPSFQVVLSDGEMKESSARERGLTGRRLTPGDTYALALRVCFKPSPTTEPSLTCVQSLWAKPVGTHLGPPFAPQPPQPVASDPDRLLWFDEPAQDSPLSLLQQPPSDDATAHGPSRYPPVHGKRQLDAPESMAPRAHSDSLDLVGPTHSAGIPKPHEPRRSHRSANASILAAVVCVTIILLMFGLACLLFAVYRRKSSMETADRLSEVHSAGSKMWHDKTRFGRTKYSLLGCVVGPTRRSPRRSMQQTSFNLAHIQGPPSGISSIAANLPPVLTPHSYYEESLVAGDPRLNGTLITCSGDSPALFGSTGRFDCSQMGSLTRDGVGNNTDTPNGTLLHNGPALRRTDSTNHWLDATSPSPSATTYPAGLRTIASPADLLPGYGRFINVGSLNSVDTGLGPRGVTPGEGPVDLGLGCTNSIIGRFSKTGNSRPIDINQLVERVDALKADNGRLMAAEFESIDPGGQFTWEHSNRPMNRAKNRYANVIAYDHSRVILQPTSISNPDSDYINANYLDGYKKLNAYIATQGPLPNTIHDFWRMVWEQRSSIIVSMTRLEERARVKCEQYWPGSGRGKTCNTTSPPTARYPPVYRPEWSRSGLRETALSESTPLKFIDPDSAPPLSANLPAEEVEEEENCVVFVNSLSQQSFLAEDSSWLGPAGAEFMSEASYGDLTVGLLEVMELAYYTVRTLVLRKSGSTERREVRQLQFTAWPDHGVPNHPAPLLMFLRRVRTECTADAGPLIVHCSAGVGRTGAFILLDILLEQLRHERAVDVFGAVNRLRAQRNFMVQTEDQYAFVYEALVEAAASGNTELTVRQLSAHWLRLIQATSEEDPIHSHFPHARTGLELEFGQIVAQTDRPNQLTTDICSTSNPSQGLLSPIDALGTRDDDMKSGSTSAPRLPALGSVVNKGSAASMRVNQWKNRDSQIVPHEANRVALKAIRGVDGSDYVNASYIDGYRSRAAYIATQAPLSGTVDDFWRMMWESGSCLIVRLEGQSSSSSSSSTTWWADQITEDMPTYWPTNQSARHGFFVVDPISTYPMSSCVMREIRLTDTRDASTARTVRLFDAAQTLEGMRELATTTARADTNASWQSFPAGLQAAEFKQHYQQLSEVMLDVIGQVHKTKEHFGLDGPITVHCRSGAGRTGVFLALSLVLDRMRHEGVVDMFQTVKLLRWQRPALVRTSAEYAFCYATALTYWESFDRYSD